LHPRVGDPNNHPLRGSNPRCLSFEAGDIASGGE
jgi:hypothetical protein